MEDVQKAYELARDARLRAYAPYSKFLVGSCIKLKNSNDYIVGQNVENASYGATVCAERVALFNSISLKGKVNIEYIVVVTNTRPATPPCALCLQVLCEFAPGSLPVYLGDLEKIEKKLLLSDLLPTPFNSIPNQV